MSGGIRTADLGGHASTSEFTDEVVRRVQAKLDVWATLEPEGGGVAALRRDS